jgi:thiol:disulfide interchange protein DsbA
MNKTIGFLLALLLPLLAISQAARAESFDEGIEYQLVTPAQPTDDPGKVEVLELFWYGCPHCFYLEPEIQAWLKTKPDNVEFRRMPAVLGQSWGIHARAFYTAEVLGVLDRIHQPLFEAIHEQNRRLNSEASLQGFFAEHGVDPGEFTKAFNSFTVESKYRRALSLTKKYGIDGVPAIIVNGKYRTSATLAGGREGMFRVVDFLVRQETGAAQ